MFPEYLVIFLIIMLVFPVSIGVSALGSFIAERMRNRDEAKEVELEKQLSIERTEAMRLRSLQIEHGLTVTPSILDDKDEL
jgi:hypothetical protein